MANVSRETEASLVAFMEDPDAPRPENPIHSTAGAREYGYRAALVGGVVVYGWATPAILSLLGQRWLEDGWAAIAFRRPTYPGDRLRLRLAEADPGIFELTLRKSPDEIAVAGRVGCGRAPWLGTYARPARRKAEPRPARLPQLTLETAPVGQDLRPIAVAVGADAARRWAIEREGDTRALFTEGEHPRLHPGWIASVMSPLLHHSYDYGPSIHVESHIQHLALAEAGQTVTVAGRMLRAYTKKGHDYHVTDGVIIDEQGRDLAYLRHTAIFRVARREGGA